MRICSGCNSDIDHGRYARALEQFWHPECFRCYECKEPIADPEFSLSNNWTYHKSCYHPKCDVCKDFIPLNADGLIEYRVHPFWQQKYCPSHESDGTTRCCSCERKKQLDAKYLALDDGRKLCPDCSDSAIMETQDCQPLYHEIQEFFQGLRMKVEQQIPVLLVESQKLNEAKEGEKNGHNLLPVTQGLCLSEEQTISAILRCPRFGKYRIIDMFMDPYRLICRYEIRAILILYGLPRLYTGSILAHEMMHAWLRLNGYFNLSPDVEEGMCEVLAHKWLDSELEASQQLSDSEMKFGEFVKNQIETNGFAGNGDGFKEGERAVVKYGLKTTLDHIRLTGCFPFD